jgi:hypothetical protein
MAKNHWPKHCKLQNYGKNMGNTWSMKFVFVLSIHSNLKETNLTAVVPASLLLLGVLHAIVWLVAKTNLHHVYVASCLYHVSNDNHRELLFCLPYFAIRPKFSMFCWLVGVGFVAFFSCTGLESTWCGKKFGVYLFILKRAMKFPCATTLALQSTISWRLKLSWCAMRFEPQ